MNKQIFMELNEYEIGKVYPEPDGTRWTFLGYYLEMPVWKVEGKYEMENDIDEADLPDRSSSKDAFRWKRIFVNYFKARTRLFHSSGKVKVS